MTGYTQKLVLYVDFPGDATDLINEAISLGARVEQIAVVGGGLFVLYDLTMYGGSEL